mgnify:CR=1 FL=1
MNNSSERKLELESVIPQYRLLFGKSTSLDEVIDVTDLALKAIGNKAQETYILRTTIKDYKIPFPCDMYLVKSITRSEPFNNNTLINHSQYALVDTFEGNTYPFVDIVDENGEVTGQTRLIYSNELPKSFVDKPVGNYIDFNNNGRDLITFNETGVEIDIIYKAPLVDPNNLPYVDEKTVTAICYYINYLDIQRKYFSKVADQNMYQMALQLKDKYIGQARVGDVFTENQTNRIFNHALSLGRKMYGLPNRI